MCIFSGELAALYQLSEESSALCVQLLIMHSAFVSTVWPAAFTLTNAFRAASDVKYPMTISTISMWVFRVGLSYVFGRALHLGLMGVWIAMGCDWTFRAILFTAHYIRGTWLTKYHPKALPDSV